MLSEHVKFSRKMEIKKKHFEEKKALQIFTTELEFIQKVFSRSALPAHISSADNDCIVNNKNKISNITIKKNGSRAQNFEELQARLEQLKGTKGLDYREKMLKKKMKNQLKKQSKRKERELKKMLVKTERNAAGGIKAEKSETEVQKAPNTKPVFNSEGHMVFSKFDFKELGTKRRLPKVEKDPKKILDKLKENKKKLRELEEVGEKEQAIKIREKEAWKSALAKASGEKVKDDPELLKRTMKREERKKERSAKKWQARMDHLQKDLQKRQQKRSENIAKKKKEKKMNKLKKAAKKGRVISGF